MEKTNSKIKIRQIDKTAAIGSFRQIASIHKAEIKEGFLSTLGLSFLSLLYKSLSNSSYSFLIFAEEEGEIIGFICGGIDTNKVMKQFIMRYGIFVIPKLISNFFSLRKIKRILETLFYPVQKVNYNLPKPEILNFCVSNEFQRKGVGKKLFYALIDRFRQIGIDQIKIVTGENQKKAQKFYESLSANKVAEIEVHKGIKSSIYTYSIV
jgi:ribosomal protein S18 acetylase RimI-like enzyme